MSCSGSCSGATWASVCSSDADSIFCRMLSKNGFAAARLAPPALPPRPMRSSPLLLTLGYSVFPSCPLARPLTSDNFEMGAAFCGPADEPGRELGCEPAPPRRCERASSPAALKAAVEPNWNADMGRFRGRMTGPLLLLLLPDVPVDELVVLEPAGPSVSVDAAEDESQAGEADRRKSGRASLELSNAPRLPLLSLVESCCSRPFISTEEREEGYDDGKSESAEDEAKDEVEDRPDRPSCAFPVSAPAELREACESGMGALPVGVRTAIDGPAGPEAPVACTPRMRSSASSIPSVSSSSSSLASYSVSQSMNALSSSSAGCDALLSPSAPSAEQSILSRAFHPPRSQYNSPGKSAFSSFVSSECTTDSVVRVLSSWSSTRIFVRPNGLLCSVAGAPSSAGRPAARLKRRRSFRPGIVSAIFARLKFGRRKSVEGTQMLTAPWIRPCVTKAVWVRRSMTMELSPCSGARPPRVLWLREASARMVSSSGDDAAMPLKRGFCTAAARRPPAAVLPNAEGPVTELPLKLASDADWRREAPPAAPAIASPDKGYGSVADAPSGARCARKETGSPVTGPVGG